LARLLVDIEEVGEEGYQFLTVFLALRDEKHPLVSYGSDELADELGNLTREDVPDIRAWVEEWRRKAAENDLDFEVKPDVGTFLREAEANA